MLALFLALGLVNSACGEDATEPDRPPPIEIGSSAFSPCFSCVGCAGVVSVIGAEVILMMTGVDGSTT